MITLDLTNEEKSDIKYKPINYPDGQRDLLIDNSNGAIHVQLREDFTGKYISSEKSPVKIKSRLNNAEDLLMIVCATKALRNLKVKEIHLYTPYIMGLRSDRLFQTGGNRYIKDVLAPILNAQNFESVTCIDAHSYVAENCINNLVQIDNFELMKFFVANSDVVNKPKMLDECILISSDAGGLKKIYSLAEKMGFKGDIINCSKDRDKEGKLSKTIVPDFDYSKDIVITDDIFDFGKSFTNISKEISKKIPESADKIGKKYLVVTHAIQEEGLKEALKYFDAIYTTNSYKDFNIERVNQLSVF